MGRVGGYNSQDQTGAPLIDSHVEFGSLALSNLPTSALSLNYTIWECDLIPSQKGNSRVSEAASPERLGALLNAQVDWTRTEKDMGRTPEIGTFYQRESD